MHAKTDHSSERPGDAHDSDGGEPQQNAEPVDEPDRSPQFRPTRDLAGDGGAQDSGDRSTSLAAIVVDLALEVPDADPPFDGWAQPLLERLLRLLGWTQAELSIAIVDDATMADLHQRYKDVPGTTDVLTFDLRETEAAQDAAPSSDGPAFEEPLEAELILCMDEAARQAADRGHAVRAELLLYAVHGLLHLAGHDDHDPAAAAAMHKREDQLLAVLGLPALYRRPGGDPDENE